MEHQNGPHAPPPEESTVDLLGLYSLDQLRSFLQLIERVKSDLLGSDGAASKS